MAIDTASFSSENTIIEQFAEAMRARDIDVDEPIIANGKLNRYHVTGDRRSTRNAWAILHIDGHPAGSFGCNKRYGPGVKFPWKMNGGADMTAEERRELKRIASERAKAREVEVAAEQEAAFARATWIYNGGQPVDIHPYLTYKGVQSNSRLRVGNWYYIDEDTGEDIVIATDALLVPMMDFSGNIHSLQAIMTDKDGDFRKQYLKNGKKEGHFLSLAKPVNDTAYIVEGLATGLTVQQDTGQCVLVAFDTGNLMYVAKALRAVKPDFKIVICADNDQWTDKPVKNPGIHYARKAAAAVKGSVVYPEFQNTDTQPTDFNDLHAREGEAIVRAFVERALEPAPAEDRPFEPGARPPDEPDGDDGGYEEPAKNAYFAILGYDHGVYYLFQHEQRQVIAYTKRDLNDGGFIELADTNWWEKNFPGANGGINKRGAMNFIIRTANQRGIFTPDKVRGRGAWVDNGHNVFHHGQTLTVDGENVEVTRIESKFVYELAAAHCKPAERPMTDEEGFALLELAGKFRWTMPGSAALLMGWIALAPFCGALQWRPHIWITGNAGSGKSTVVDSLVNRLLAGMCLYGLGGSTEAGIRQMLKSDALPVLIDESEQNEEKDVNRIQSILGLMRQASTESQARTFKGTPGGNAMAWHIRSMFCLSSIQVGVKHQADSERISVLTLLPKLTDGRAAEQWEMLRDEIHALIAREPDISGRLFRRTLDKLPAVLANIEVFKSAAARIFKSQRSGDQYGTLLAGCFSLFSGKLATPADAESVINTYVWTEHVELDTHDESARAFECLMARPIRCGMHDLTVIEVINVARGRLPHPEGVVITAVEANEVLQRHGMRVDKSGNYLMIANGNQEFLALMANTAYSAGPRGVLKRSPHIDNNDNTAVKINSVSTKVLRCDLLKLLGESTTASTVEPPETPY